MQETNVNIYVQRASASQSIEEIPLQFNDFDIDERRENDSLLKKI